MFIGSVRRSRLVAGALVAFTLVAGACGGDDSNSKTAASSAGTATTTTTVAQSSQAAVGKVSKADPCSLITGAEAAAILGGSATRGAAKSENRGVNCQWKNAATAGFVLVQVFNGKEFYSPSAQASHPQTLSGVGDEAFVDASGTTTVNVGFVKGDTVVFVQGFQVKSKDAVIAAAKDAASKV